MLVRSRCSVAARSAPVQRTARIVVRASSQKVEKTNKVQLQNVVAPAVVTAVANAIMASPAAAAGKLFDFDLTLPIMAGEFLLLMIFLDKTWFGPVGKVLDERDTMIRYAAFLSATIFTCSLQRKCRRWACAGFKQASVAVTALHPRHVFHGTTLAALI